jgi:hypothetical protein
MAGQSSSGASRVVGVLGGVVGEVTVARTSTNLLVLICLLALSVTIFPNNALACGRPPLLPWRMLVSDDGPPVWIGRVSSVTPNHTAYRNRDFEVRQSTANIETLEALHGSAPNVYEFVGYTNVRVRNRSAGPWCGPAMTLAPGDIVLIIPDDTFGDYVLKPADSPPEIISKLESYQ